MSDNLEKTELNEETEALAAADASQTEPAPERPKGGLDGFYENFRHIPLKYIDRFIGVCVVLLVAVIVFGIVQAKL